MPRTLLQMITSIPSSLPPSCIRRLAVAVCLAGLVHTSTAAQDANPPTISEMLELGVYTEETKCDLDAAMQCYQKVIADSTASQ